MSDKPKHSLAETDLSVGDRIKVVAHLREEPIPPPVGTTGTIIEDGSDDGLPKARVKWDQDGTWVRTLVFPMDRVCIEIINNQEAGA